MNKDRHPRSRGGHWPGSRKRTNVARIMGTGVNGGKHGISKDLSPSKQEGLVNANHCRTQTGSPNNVV
ncbi:hypothetical protein CC2G_015087 [Coprinopsis cinerea AmutBmut pab1-1]|nr:hypothetical protein CC2G_015087 [Coprinopsis cinerea AmutBmut pab1-1]